MKKKSFLFLLSLVLQCNSALLWAQIEPEEIKQEADQFQDLFYESLLQKGIENYDKAVLILNKAIKFNTTSAAVYNELGRNYFALKDYNNAYISYENAAKIDPTNKWFWLGMYEVTYETKNFKQGIVIINKLIEFDLNYKEDLTSLYMATNQLEKALTLIQELEQTVGKTDRREIYKSQILSQGKFQNIEITNLITQIEKYPKEESNYLNLLFLYSKNKEEAKAFEIVKKLEEAIPNSEWAQVTLFKNYLETNQISKAIVAMNTVLASFKIDSKIKHRILNEFLIFSYKNPEYSLDLEKAVSYFDTDKSIDVAKEIGRFFDSKKQWDRAVKYYENSANSRPDEALETNLLLLQAYTEIKEFDLVAKKALEMIAHFPTQPQFYYYAGLAKNQLQEFKEAKDLLEIGIDYVVDNTALELHFTIQLGEAYNGLGDLKKKEFFFSKANRLLKEKNNEK